MLLGIFLVADPIPGIKDFSFRTFLLKLHGLVPPKFCVKVCHLPVSNYVDFLTQESHILFHLWSGTHSGNIAARAIGTMELVKLGRQLNMPNCKAAPGSKSPWKALVLAAASTALWLWRPQWSPLCHDLPWSSCCPVSGSALEWPWYLALPFFLHLPFQVLLQSWAPLPSSK